MFPEIHRILIDGPRIAARVRVMGGPIAADLSLGCRASRAGLILVAPILTAAVGLLADLPVDRRPQDRRGGGGERGCRGSDVAGAPALPAAMPAAGVLRGDTVLFGTRPGFAFVLVYRQLWWLLPPVGMWLVHAAAAW